MLNNENLKTVTIGHEAKYGGPSEVDPCDYIGHRGPKKLILTGCPY